MMLLFLMLDAAAWAGTYLALSEFTGDFNRFGWAEVLLPMIISIFTLSLIGAYDPRSEMKSLGYTSEHLITCFAAFLLSAFVPFLSPVSSSQKPK